MKKIVTILLSSVMLFAFAGCGGDAGNAGGAGDSSGTAALSGTVTLTGSTTIQPVVQSIADIFQQTNGGVQVDISANGSSEGVKGVSQGTCDIGMVSRELKAEEKEMGLTEHILAYDGVAVIVNKNNPVSGLSIEQIKGIYEGTITNWNQVGGQDASIVVVGREDGSGTREAFESLVGLKEMVASAAKFDKTSAVETQISNTENAIGYISLGYVNDTIKPVEVDGVKASVETVKSGTYKIQRPLLLVTKNELSKEAQAFLDFCLGAKGQEVVAEKYIPAK